jgi:hypothetical protein
MAMKIPLYDETTKKEAEDRGIPELADGKYTFLIEDYESRSRGTENPQPCIMVRLKVLEGPSPGPAWDFWMLPSGEMTDGQRSFWKGHWFRVARALPGLYDETKQEFEPAILKGAKCHATIVHETYKDRDGNEKEAQRFRSYRVDPRTGVTAAAPAAAAPAAAPAEKPAKFATP